MSIKTKKIKCNVPVVLASDDIERLSNYLNYGTGDIDDILIEITTQASVITKKQQGTKYDMLRKR